MAIQILVDKSVYDQEQEVTINGQTYYFRFRYNTSVTESPWFLDILDSNKEYLLAGKRVLHGSPTTSSFLRETLGGMVLCINSAYDGSPVTEESFHTEGKHNIVYITDKELEDAVST